MNPWLIVLIAVIGTAALVTAALCLITYNMAFYRNPKKHKADPYRAIKDDSPGSVYSRKLIDHIVSLKYENIYTESHDGLRLRARLYKVKEDAPFVIQCHGYKSTPMLDFSGGGALAMEMSMNVIMIDQRAHGESEGRTISFGLNESRDLSAWVEYVVKNYGEDRKILLNGISMGAATVLMASAMPLPKNVVGIAADCPYSSTKEIIKKVIRDMHLPADILYPFVRLGARVLGGFDPDKCNPEEAVKSASLPILLVHGEADSFVPFYMSERIKASNPNIEFHAFPNADHGKSFIEDTDRYKTAFIEFSERCLALKNSEN
ncbi:MAG: alpha/beta hydrolase [Ruminococcaceae bacterium]|nr:alpha/beta hydrolase [Oscillospiraceae bacterium]